MKSTTISSMMLHDHGKIVKLLNECKQAMKEDTNEGILKSFDKFAWELERHIFVEERVIFRQEISLSKDSHELIQAILEDHQMLSDMLKEIEKSLREKDYNLNIPKIERFLSDHKDREDRDLYPRLDDELNPELKKFMVEQLKTRIF